MDVECRHRGGFGGRVTDQLIDRRNRRFSMIKLPKSQIISMLLVNLLLMINALPVDQKTTPQQTPAVTPVEPVTSASQLAGISHGRRPVPNEGIEFPNTAFIPGDLTEQLSVDGFFSLWFVFLDDDVFTSGNVIHFFIFQFISS